MTLNARTAHPKNQSYRLWWDAADQCILSHGTYTHIIMQKNLELYYWNLLERTKNMMTSSNGNIFRVTGPLCGELVTGEFLAQRPVTRSFDAFFHLHLNKLLSKQS